MAKHTKHNIANPPSNPDQHESTTGDGTGANVDKHKGVSHESTLNPQPGHKTPKGGKNPVVNR